MYANFRRYSVNYDQDCFSVFYDGMGEILRAAGIREIVSDPPVSLADYARPTASVRREEQFSELTVRYGGAALGRKDITLTFTLRRDGVTVQIGGEGTWVRLGGLVHWGAHDQKETMAVNLNGASRALRCAYGPAATALDNALFDRDTDRALVFDTSGKLRLRYDWDADCYAFTLDTQGLEWARSFTVHVEKDVYARKFDIDYKKRSPNTVFRTPPVGWMTWYAVQFEAGEKAVLENTAWQAENLKKYGADTIWVDWEWYHRDFSSAAPEGVDMYHPDPKAYPHGLGYVAEKIEEAGFIPALWVGPTCDPGENEMIRACPEAVMAHRKAWCGQYFLDPTHPAFLDEMLPRMLRQAPDWGYKAVKWDCLPMTAWVCDDRHDDLADPSLSTRQAMLRMFRRAREVLGEDYPMLYCAGVSERDVDLACAVFDSMRVGGDIFRWEEFITQCVDRVYRYYMLHDVVCSCDPDNVILREKFNTYDQALTRAAFVSLAGLPFTMGDDLPALPEDRVELLRRSIPPVPAHPTDIRSASGDGRTAIVSLAVERPDLRWTVADVINLSQEPDTVRVSLAADLGLDEGAYYVYDYWNRVFLGVFEGAFEIDLRPCASRILSLHRVCPEPQVLSTSWHISQGVPDLLSVRYDAEKKALFGDSRVIGGEPYEIVVSAGEGLRVFGEGNYTGTREIERLADGIWRCTFRPREDGELHWEIGFTPKIAE